MIVLERLSSDGLYVRREREAGLTLLAAIPFAGMAALPLFEPGMTVVRVLTSAVLFAVSCGLVWFGLRHRIVERRFTDQQLAEASSILLTGTHPRAGFAAYRAELCFANGTQSVLFEHRAPEIVLRDIKRLIESRPLPVRNGWGLPDDATPWSEERSRNTSNIASELHEQAWVWPAQTQTAWTAIIGTIVVCGIASVMLISRVRRGLSISEWSLALPLVSFASIFAASIIVLTSRIEFLRRGDELVIQRLALGRVLWRRVVSCQELTAVYFVGAGGPQHLLFVTRSELFSVPCFGPNAERIQRRFAGSA